MEVTLAYLVKKREEAERKEREKRRGVDSVIEKEKKKKVAGREKEWRDMVEEKKGREGQLWVDNKKKDVYELV